MSNFNPMSIMLMLNTVKSQDGTESMFIKMIILVITFYQIFENIIPFNTLKNYVINWIRPEYINIVLPSAEVPISTYTSGKTTMYKVVYSQSFLAVMHYIMNNKCNITSLTEIMVNNSETALFKFFNNDNLEKENKTWKSKDQFEYFPIYTKEFIIYDDIYCLFDVVDNSTSEKGENKSQSDNQKRRDYIITLFIKSTNPLVLHKIKNFINDCIKTYQEYISTKYDKNIQYIFEYNGCEKSEKDAFIYPKFKEYEMKHNKDLLTNIYFDGKDRLISYINDFVYDRTKPENYISDGEAKYVKCGFTFKAGLLFYGSPGCGKTSTIKAILKYTNRNGIIINLNKVKTCEELEIIFRTTIINEKKFNRKQLCFILEDCDAFGSNSNSIKSRNNSDSDEKVKDENSLATKIIEMNMAVMELSSTGLKNEDELNLSCFLNILDGIIELYGVMIIMTTNYPERIDSALIRPGRFDFKYEFKKMTRANVVEMLKYKFEISNDEWDKKYSKYLKINDHILSPAEVQSICFKNHNIMDCINEIVLSAQKTA